MIGSPVGVTPRSSSSLSDVTWNVPSAVHLPSHRGAPPRVPPTLLPCRSRPITHMGLRRLLRAGKGCAMEAKHPCRNGVLALSRASRSSRRPGSSRPSDAAVEPGADADGMKRTVDVLEGNTFVVSDERGDIDGSPAEAHGLFDRDTRYLSRWVLMIDGQRLSTLSVDTTRYYAAQFFLAPGVASAYVNAKLAVIRRRTVLDGFHEVVSLTNHDAVDVTLELVLSAEADFADLFEVKDATVPAKPGRTYTRVDEDRLVLGYERETYRRETWIRASGNPVYEETGLRFSVTLAPQQSWSSEIDVLTVRGGQPAAFPDRSVWDDPEK